MKFKYISLLVVAMGMLIGGCKEKTEVFEDPYKGGRDPLGIVVNKEQIPVPAAGQAGTIVKIAATGLEKHKDSLKFMFNGEFAEVVNVTATGIEARVPNRASSGVTAFVVNQQIVFGPDFTVFGLVNRDPTFKVVLGTNGLINRAVPIAEGKFMLLGDFTDFDNKGAVKPIRRILRMFPDGTYDRGLLSATGSNGQLSSMATIGSQFYISGGFSGYAQRDGINNITKISNLGVIDTTAVTTYTLKQKNISTFNGGFDGFVDNVYAFNNKIIAAGNFRYYVSRRYNMPTRKLQDSVVIDSVDVRQLARLNTDGSLDRTWRFDPEAIGYGGYKGKSLPGATGSIQTLMHTDGKLLVWGTFSKFDDQAAGYIVRLNADGTRDQSFTANADYYINYVSFNATTNKYVAVGIFKSFNGKPTLSMVTLNYDGTVDESFKPKVFGGGFPTYVKQLDDGLSVVGGFFNTYDGVSRPGFLIVDKTGGLAEGYNTIGNLLGRILDVVETKSADNKRALLIVGSFSTFDNQPINNIVRVTME
ncbi:DUF5008 domain-containing protein [Pedobacter psychroterrae]|uniref:DUF5008 domain-containing protein n=1 Tax=Pedobacter psychroterrae TaxID=2530453 RepID=A0A4R0NKR7_9SPHI|nr:DUF5008 domain-containing protein [Pedobacter psychroterrae]TCD01331.1 DUF5008 domain-containing protein [Pedobacter psychroterrae]